MLSVTLTRAALTLPDLTITDNPYAGDFHLDEVGHPGFALRRTHAPESGIIAGRVLLSAVKDIGTLPLTLYVHGDDTAAVEAAKDELEAATSQWSYSLTLTVDGVSRTYSAQPELPTWGPIDSGMVRAHMAVATIVIPLNPGSA